MPAPDLTLGPTEFVAGCWAGGHGTGWTNQCVYVVIEDQNTKAVRIIALDVEDQTPEIRAQFSLHFAAFRALMAALRVG